MGSIFIFKVIDKTSSTLLRTAYEIKAKAIDIVTNRMLSATTCVLQQTGLPEPLSSFPQMIAMIVR